MKSALAKQFTARLGMAGALASAMLFAVPALAQNRLSLADRVSRLEQQAQAQNQGGTGMVNQVQQLQAQVQQLQGQVEELQHQLQQMQDKSKAQYIDLDSRLGRLEGNGAGTNTPAAGGTAAPATPGSATSGSAIPGSDASATAPAGAAAGTASAATGAGNAPVAAGTGNAPAKAPDANAQAAYDAAFNALRGGDYAQASRGFRGFIQQYPDDALAPNAWYWLGESYYVTMNYPVALEAFQRLLAQFPQSEKAPDALLKVGYSQLELKQVDAGEATLQTVASKYPNSRAANLAQERLRRLQLPSAIR